MALKDRASLAAAGDPTQLPVKKCDRCKGTGEGRYRDTSGPISSNIYSCPTCKGTGSLSLVLEITRQGDE